MLNYLSVVVDVVMFDSNKNDAKMLEVKKTVDEIRDNLLVGSKIVTAFIFDDLKETFVWLSKIIKLNRQVFLLTHDPVVAQEITNAFFSHEKETNGLRFQKTPFTTMCPDDRFIGFFPLYVQYFNIYSEHYYKKIRWDDFSKLGGLVSTISVYRQTMWEYIKLRRCMGFKLNEEEREFEKGYGIMDSERVKAK